eukprot:XP_001706689.1 Hypothetical protein GL50803_28397 [Giardia lamblia ATCC 50803]
MRRTCANYILDGVHTGESLEAEAVILLSYMGISIVLTYPLN